MNICRTLYISFLLNRFSFEYRFPFVILNFFTVKSPGVTQRLVSQENAFKKEQKNPSVFFLGGGGGQNYKLK